MQDKCPAIFDKFADKIIAFSVGEESLDHVQCRAGQEDIWEIVHELGRKSAEQSENAFRRPDLINRLTNSAGKQNIFFDCFE